MHAIQAVLQDVHHALALTGQQCGDAKTESPDENVNTTAERAGPWAAKNTIVKDVLRELTNASRRTKNRF